MTVSSTSSPQPGMISVTVVPDLLPILSPRRLDLCSRLNAQRVAARLNDALGTPIAVIRTGNPIQPFRVADRFGSDAIVELEVRT